ncbi:MULTISPECIES: Flp family type IVb pilin [Burkholderia]|uniref:Flp family type IVb pilin n=1 Tax=Burkholderia TaxID=32008 RepID=UPI0008420BBF|nr:MULTISPECIES: Flp family type IVb pilin [unclassified Burkholderia]AOK29919.1 pilus assembly protein [Burkholderia sp. Bp7605]
MKALIKRFLKDEAGVTAIEYGLIAGLLAVAIVAAVGGDTGLTGSLKDAFAGIARQVQTNAPAR